MKTGGHHHQRARRATIRLVRASLENLGVRAKANETREGLVALCVAASGVPIGETEGEQWQGLNDFIDRKPTRPIVDVMRDFKPMTDYDATNKRFRELCESTRKE